MQYISRCIKDIPGLHVKQFFWDDTALVGTPEAVAQAAAMIQDLSIKTGLKLKWKKCHVHGTSPTIARCNKMSNPGFAAEITMHDSFNMMYLKAPVGSDGFVSQWLDEKLITLKQIVRSIAQMPFKHEAYSLLRSCAAECRVTYLMRILPPRQISCFMQSFDKVLREGFEEILGCSLSNRWWRLAKLPPKFGGMSMRSGLNTFGAQHLVSISKSATEVDRIVNGWNSVEVAKQETEAWINNACRETVDVEEMVRKLKVGHEDNADDLAPNTHKYSITQLCELYEQRRVSELMSNQERLHIEAHSGPHHAWVTLLPLEFMRYNMTPSVWATSARKRLRLDVYPVEKQCSFCKWGRCDVKGEHATTCAGGSSRILRHNTLRDIVAKAVRDCGYKTDIEHGGGLADQRRPGDVIVYNWQGGKHLLIDVAVTNPLCLSHGDILHEQGAGGPATAYEKTKVSKYHDLDHDRYEYLPFVVETCGGLGDAARTFCKELQKRRASKSCLDGSEHDDRSWHQNDLLLTAISIEMQRFNSQMILERNPVTENLLESKFFKCKLAIAKRKEKASETLKKKILREHTSINSNPVGDGGDDSINHSVSDGMNHIQLGKVCKEKKDTCGDVGQQSIPQLEQLPDPPDPSGGHSSPMVLRDWDRDGSTVEHYLAIKQDYNSQEVSTTSKVPIPTEVSDSPMCSDWRRNHDLNGEQIAWEPPVPARSVSKSTPLLKLTNNNKLGQE